MISENYFKAFRKIDSELAQILHSSKILSKYAVAIRYPDAQGLDLKIDEDTVIRSLNLAEAVFVEINSRLK